MKIKDLFKDETIEINWDYIETLDEFKVMMGCPHSKKWHREGDPWQHTKIVTRMMELIFDLNVAKTKLSTKWSDKDYRQLMVASALCHDLGKPSTTYWNEEDNDYHCAHHGAASESIVRELFKDEDTLRLESLAWLVRYHMDFYYIMLKGNPSNVLKKLDDCINEKGIRAIVSLGSMLTLHMVDSMGSINNEKFFERIYDIEMTIRGYEMGKLIKK